MRYCCDLCGSPVDEGAPEDNMHDQAGSHAFTLGAVTITVHKPPGRHVCVSCTCVIVSEDFLVRSATLVGAG
jgi:hypothetical protein